MDSDIDLDMECCTPSLTDTQLSIKSQADEEYKRFMKKFNESLVKRNGEVIEKGTVITVYEMDCVPNFPARSPLLLSEGLAGTPTIKPTPTSALLATTQANLISNSNVLLTNGNVTSSSVFSPTTYQLVVSPRMGLMIPATVASVPTVTSGSPTTQTGSVPVSAPRVQVRSGLGTLNPLNNANVVQQPVKRFIAPVSTTSKSSVSVPVTKSIPVAVTKNSPIVTSVSSINTRNKSKQMAGTADGTITTVKTINKVNDVNTTVVDLTDDDGKQATDPKETSSTPSSRYPGTIYPSLVVVARPSLRMKELTSSTITAERSQLDTKVKGILSNSATKFTEWLIQQGLVRSEQICNNHPNGDVDPAQRKLKLGMYSDVSKFPYSGGYIWISDCCPQKFVSVFCNSIFEGAPHAPTILLKLMYHWACQTNVHNIISWVKVDNLYIKNFFTNLRAVCMAAVCEKFGKLGGPGKKIEVGVISLGTTSRNGCVRQVKVEVLGVMDPVTKHIRLRAVEPVPNAEKNHKQRFQRIFEALDQWVHKSTTIVTDYTVDKAALVELGFSTIIQSSLNAYSKDNNRCVMDYLKRVVPRMFQNTLSLLSKSIIQQFLDELVWRERWGSIPSRAFDNLIVHLAEMTKLDTGDTLINRLKSITMNPFRDWSYKNWRSNCIVLGQQGKRLPPPPTAEGAKLMIVKSKSNAPLPINSKLGQIHSSNILSNDTANISDLPTIDNLPPSIKEVDDDNVAMSSGSSSRRSRCRTTAAVPSLTTSILADDSKSKNHAICAQQVTDNVMPLLVSLENYYYGTITPDVGNSNKSKMKELNMKCFACGLTYNNNIELMKHLAGHAQDEGAFTTDYRCKYCFKNFTNMFDLEDHEGKTHLPNKYVTMCYICCERFSKRSDLIRHMHWLHTELELPYQCSICKFRSSMHTAVVDHFYEVHNGCEKVQCPFCLKIVSFEGSNGNKIPQNVNFFFSHLQRHQAKSVRKCSKCVLCFMNKNLVKEHQAKDHTSCVDTLGVVRYTVDDLSSTLMTLPANVIPMTRKGKPLPISIPSYSTYQLTDSLYYPEVPISKCLECKSDITTPSQHFDILYNCMNCRFSSCCKTTMTKHVRKIHDQKLKRKQSVHKPMPLSEPLYCVCGFSTSCGNTMASHLAACRRRVAYPSSQRAAQYSVQMQSATFPQLVNLDDIEQESSDPSERWMQAFTRNAGENKKPSRSEPSPPRMLKELGLVRKGPEEDSGKNSEVDNVNANVPIADIVDKEPSVEKSVDNNDQSLPAETSPVGDGGSDVLASSEENAVQNDKSDEPPVNVESQQKTDIDASKEIETDVDPEIVRTENQDSQLVMEERKDVEKDVDEQTTELTPMETDEGASPTDNKVNADESVTVTPMECQENSEESSNVPEVNNEEVMSTD